MQLSRLFAYTGSSNYCFYEELALFALLPLMQQCVC